MADNQCVDRHDLRIWANQACADLGPEPVDPDQHEIWVQERRGVVMLLANVADCMAQVLRDAAIGAWVHPAARDLLLDAAQECP